MLKKTTNNTAHCYVFRKTRNSRPQHTGATNDQVDMNSCSGHFIQLINDLLIGKAIELRNDMGWTSRTVVHPPDDAFSLVRFNSRLPLETVFITWPEGTTPDPAAWISLKEVTP